MNEDNKYPNAVMLTAKDMKKSIAFYRDTLGFMLRECWPDENAPMWASLLLDRQSVMLGAQMDAAHAKEMCAGDPGAIKYMETLAAELQKNKRGVGIVIYLQVPDVDAYHASVVKKGVKNVPPPKSQFYGLREFGIEDPDGFRFMFYTPIAMSTCQSCGMPLKDAKPGEMYCHYCVDASGKLKPYEQVLEGTTTGYFMQMKKMPRDQAQKAAREHLATMPAWKARK